MPSQWVWEARWGLFSQPQRALKTLEERGSRGGGGDVRSGGREKGRARSGFLEEAVRSANLPEVIQR